MKRAMRVSPLTHEYNYFGEFHALATQLKNESRYANCRGR